MREELETYEQYLEERELSESTIKTYIRYTERFLDYNAGHELRKRNVIGFRDAMLEDGNMVTTVNLATVSINRFLKYCGFGEYTIKTKRHQRRKSLDNVICESDYQKLLGYALRTGRNKYYAIMKTLALTGIRVSELEYVTVEALEHGYTQVNNKGKVREIYFPDNLVQLLKEYCERKKITRGVIFCGSKGTAISRVAVWKGLKYLAEKTGVEREKVYPHSFRHFFAKRYMRYYSNVFELADIMGHSNLETTRIYLIESIEQKRMHMGMLDINN